MSRLVLMEVAMKEELPELYDIYFGGQILLHYEDDIPFIVVGTTSRMSKNAAIELIRRCEQFKAYHKYLFEVEVKSFVMDDKNFKKVNNWWEHFHPNGFIDN
jgi:hypothetical protein